MDAMELTDEGRASLEALLRPAGYDGSVSARAQMVLWYADGYSVAEIARMSDTSKQTVYTWLGRYHVYGVDGLVNRVPTGRPPDISDEVRSKILALSQQTPPEETGLSHWSSREMANYLKQKLGILVSHNFVASLWRGHGLQPYRQGTFKLSTDSRFEEKVVDVVGLYVNPPEGAVILSSDEKT